MHARRSAHGILQCKQLQCPARIQFVHVVNDVERHLRIEHRHAEALFRHQTSQQMREARPLGTVQIHEGGPAACGHFSQNTDGFAVGTDNEVVERRLVALLQVEQILIGFVVVHNLGRWKSERMMRTRPES